MGFRTVVMLNNDHCHEWARDPLLGQKIRRGMNHTQDADRDRADIQHGRVVECCHESCVTLAMIDGYEGFVSLAHGSDGTDATALLQRAADKLGYRLVKKHGRARAAESESNPLSDSR